MANWYVWSGATGTGTGADWANAYTTLNAAATAKAAGDVFYVAHDHVQTVASALTITFAGTEANPNRVYCVNRAGSVPPVAADLRTTAQISTTGANAISLAGSCAEMYGIIFSAGDAANNAGINVGSTANRSFRLNSCALKINNTNASSRVSLCSGASGQFAILENTTLQFGSVSQQLSTSARAIWRNTPNAFQGVIFPTTLMTFSGGGGEFFVEGVDLSALGSGKTLVASGVNSPNLKAIFKDCKLGASVTVVATAANFGSVEVMLIRCDSGDTNYRTEKYAFGGVQSVETTIVRTGGATDGTTPISWKLATVANAEWEFPLECLPIVVWNDIVGLPKTVTVEGIWATGTVPNNDDIYIDVEYLGTSGFPIASKASSTKATGFVAGTPLPAGSGTWGGSTTKFKMSVTITPQEKGPFTIYVKAAKPSSTFYVDPKPVIT